MTLQDKSVSRRRFLKASSTVALGAAVYPSVMAAAASGQHLTASGISLGVFASYSHASYLRSLGCNYIEESVGDFLIPKEGNTRFAQNVNDLHKIKFPIWSYVILLPGDMKTLGPDVNHEAVLARTEMALKRAKECGSQYIVFGSGASRMIPEGFDREKAKQQHIEVTKKMAPLAEKYGITIAVEPLNRGETNFINSLAEGVEIVEAVNSPKVKLLCDIYHMLKEDEPADQIVKFGKHIVHCHIAEKQNRTPPGVAGDDFKAYLSALKKIKYKGGLSIECFVYQDFDSQAKKGIEVLKQQMSEV